MPQWEDISPYTEQRTRVHRFSWTNLLILLNLAGFVVTNWMLVEALFLAFFIGILSGVVPSFGAARRSVAATLREVF